MASSRDCVRSMQADFDRRTLREGGCTTLPSPSQDRMEQLNTNRLVSFGLRQAPGGEESRRERGENTDVHPLHPRVRATCLPPVPPLDQPECPDIQTQP